MKGLIFCVLAGVPALAGAQNRMREHSADFLSGAGPGKSGASEDGVLARDDGFDGCYVRGRITHASGLNNSRLAQTFTMQLNNNDVQERLRKLYKLDAATYDKLYRLSVGIMGAETKFGRSPKYWAKERFPWLVSSVKKFKNAGRSLASVKELVGDVELGIIHEGLATFNQTYSREAMVPLLFDVSQNSRGPTQIKYLPEKLHKAFPEINKENLSMGSSSAIATLAYLAEAMNRLKRLADRYGCEIPEDKFIEHTLYLYSGNADEIVNCTATLDKNIFYQKVMKAQSKVDFVKEGAGC
jgi:hypothetical protein